MDNLNLINKNNIDSEASESSDKDVNKLINQEKITRIVFDQNQLNYFKFKLSFKDGFKFGLGLITAYSIVILIIFIFLGIISFYFFDNFIVKNKLIEPQVNYEDVMMKQMMKY